MNASSARLNFLPLIVMLVAVVYNAFSQTFLQYGAKHQSNKYIKTDVRK